jgi:hypothetical protein
MSFRYRLLGGLVREATCKAIGLRFKSLHLVVRTVRIGAMFVDT